VADAELACGLTACSGYGTAADWADEIQVRFRMPHPGLGGPWLIRYVAFYMSGTGDRAVLIRDPGAKVCPTGAPPGPVLDVSFSFEPVAAIWPPGGWTLVEFTVGPPYPQYLVAEENGPFMVGTALMPGDAMGLTTLSAGGDGWGHHAGAWEADTANRSITPAVRIGLTDLGLSGAEISTWSSIKALFR
jgi:hypothetical protein